MVQTRTHYNQTAEKDKESLKDEEETHHVLGIINKINEQFIIRNHEDQKTVDKTFKVLKEKTVNQEFSIW